MKLKNIIIGTAYLLLVNLPLLAFQQTGFSNVEETYLPDSIPYIIVDKISFVGNKKTKEVILRRELGIKKNDTLLTDDLRERLLLEKNKIFNTDLFITVDVQLAITTPSPYYEIKFLLKERWYLFPVIVFELADRNFNEWWRDRGADLSRTNYGIRFVKRNVRGRNETVEALIQRGFTEKYEFFYTFPYLDKKQLYGLEYKISYSEEKAIAFRTFDNVLDFVPRSEDVLRERFYTSIRLRRRDGFYKFHFLELRYENNSIADTIARLNPNYYLDGKQTQQFLRAKYEFLYDRRDVTYYPLKGHFARFSSTKFGVFSRSDIDMLTFTAEYDHYFPVTQKLFGEVGFTGRLLFQNKQPYAQAQGLGYGDNFIRGYQFYVIDGQHYVLGQGALKWELLNLRKTLRFIPIKEFQTVPLAVYFRMYADAGYIEDNIFQEVTNNQLANQWLYGAGMGLDIVSFYNLVIQLDFGINALAETGFFVNISGTF